MYGSRTELNAHMRHHFDIRPYRCGLCEFNSTQRICVLRHIRCRHFKIPISKKMQRSFNIVEERNAADYLVVNEDLLD